MTRTRWSLSRSLMDLMPMLLFLVGLLVGPTIAEQTAADTTGSVKPLTLLERFQKDDQTGVITDFQTGRQWREGPNKATSWSGAQTWIHSLGADWRTPTRAELKTLFITAPPGRSRSSDHPQGGIAGKKAAPRPHASVAAAGPLPIRLWGYTARKGEMPPLFLFPAEVSSIWANRRDLSSAWAVSFETGGDCWENGNLSFSHGYRALAINAGD